MGRYLGDVDVLQEAPGGHPAHVEAVQVRQDLMPGGICI